MDVGLFTRAWATYLWPLTEEKWFSLPQELSAPNNCFGGGGTLQLCPSCCWNFDWIDLVCSDKHSCYVSRKASAMPYSEDSTSQNSSHHLDVYLPQLLWCFLSLEGTQTKISYLRLNICNHLFLAHWPVRNYALTMTAGQRSFSGHQGTRN